MFPHVSKMKVHRDVQGFVLNDNPYTEVRETKWKMENGALAINKLDYFEIRHYISGAGFQKQLQGMLNLGTSKDDMPVLSVMLVCLSFESKGHLGIFFLFLIFNYDKEVFRNCHIE